MADTVVDRHRIGALRWTVTLARRNQPAQPTGTGIDEPWINLRRVHCCIEYLRPVTFYGALTADVPITHMISMRWTDWLDNTQAILRTTLLRDGITWRTEIYRVRRYMEVSGRKRFVDVEAQLEREAE